MDDINFTDCLEILESWYELHHGDCQEPTCAMAEAYSQNLTTLASEVLIGAIGIQLGNSNNEALEKKAFHALRSLENDYKYRYEKKISEERQELLKVNHLECKTCNAITWQPEFCDYHCMQCDSSLEKEY